MIVFIVYFADYDDVQIVAVFRKESSAKRSASALSAWRIKRNLPGCFYVTERELR